MPATRILLGVIGRPHGVRGQVRVTSYADPPEALTAYGALADDRGRQFLLSWHGEGLAKVVEVTGTTPIEVTDRAGAERLTNTRLYIDRDRLPTPEEDEFYLADLIGLAAVDPSGAAIGEVAAVHDYGAGASLEIAGQGAPPLLVPFTRASVPTVDIAAGRLSICLPEAIEGEPQMEAAE